MSSAARTRRRGPLRRLIGAIGAFLISFHLRIALGTLLVSAASMGVLGVVTFQEAQRNVADAVTSRAMDRSYRMAEAMAAAPDSTDAKALLRAAGWSAPTGETTSFAMVVVSRIADPPIWSDATPAHRATAGITPPDVESYWPSCVVTESPVGTEAESSGRCAGIADIESFGWTRVKVAPGYVATVVVAGTSTGEESGLPWRLTLVMATAAPPVLLGSGLLSWLFALWLRRPVVRTAKAARAIGAGDLDRRVKVRGHDELAQVGRSVNDMADQLTGRLRQLEQAEAVQRQFVSDVAHELRTPTASLLAGATALENPATRDEAAVRIAPELRRLSALTEDLLEVSRFDAGRQRLSVDRVDLGGLARRVAASAGGAQVSAVGDVSCVVDPRRIAMIVRNLVRNAHVHGAEPVSVIVLGDPHQVRLYVTDEGPGVPLPMRERIFDRFVQADESRHGSGSGLGLAIARENAHLHGGTLGIEPDGRTFLLTLPRREQLAEAEPTLVLG